MFHTESDRAAAILVGSYLEILLGKLLRTKFIQNPVVEDLFKGTGALATFSSRIVLCYALGYIEDNTYRDLNLVRRIRNHFAHNIENASFDDPEVRSRCAKFSLVKHTLKSGQEEYLPQDARSKFIVSVGIMSQSITREFSDEWLKRYGVVITAIVRAELSGDSRIVPQIFILRMIYYRCLL